MGVGAGGHGEDVVEFLEGALLGFGQEEEDEHERGEVEAGVEAKGADRVQGEQQAGEGDAERRGPEEAGGDGPAHADLAVGQGEDLGRVRVGHGAFAGRVEGGEEVDEQRDQAEVRATVLRDDEAEPRGQQGPGHLREGKEEQRAPAPRVDGPHGWPGKDEVDQAEPPAGEESLQVVGPGLEEDGRAVEGDDVDAAHLLRKHDDARRHRRAAHPRDREQLDEARHVVAVPDDARLFGDLRVDVVQVARRLERRVAQAAERFKGLFVAALFDVPARRFRTEIHAEHERHGGDEGAAHLEAPRDRPGVDHGQVGGEAEEDAKGRPELPRHDEAAADDGGTVLGRVDRHRRCFAAHADPEQQARHEELRPRLRTRRPDDREETKDGGEEDGASAAQVVVQLGRQPATTIYPAFRLFSQTPPPPPQRLANSGPRLLTRRRMKYKGRRSLCPQSSYCSYSPPRRPRLYWAASRARRNRSARTGWHRWSPFDPSPARRLRWSTE